jgi:hypothetical protein
VRNRHSGSKRTRVEQEAERPDRPARPRWFRRVPRTGIVSAILAGAIVLVMFLVWGPTGGGDPRTSRDTSSSASSEPSSEPSPDRTDPQVQLPQVRLPPANAGFDYQLSEPYPVPSGVSVVTRDRTAPVAAGAYNICYVNAFQAQPDEISWWRKHHPELLLRHNGSEVVDSFWDETLFDVSTPARRESLLAIVGPWIDGCAAAGFDAVEPDNLDSWTRSEGLLNQDQAVAFAGMLADRAHANGLAIAQKNASELETSGRSAGLDFAVAEQCQDYENDDGLPECENYIAVYGPHLLVVEYDREHFRQACSRYGPTLPVVLRDEDLSAPGSGDYLFDTC